MKKIFILTKQSLYRRVKRRSPRCVHGIGQLRTRQIQPSASWAAYEGTFTVGRMANTVSWFPLNPPPPLPVSHRRFLDNVPLAINHELIYGLVHPDRGGLNDVLYRRLGIDGAGADAQCEKLLQEPPNVGVAREELSARYERLSAAGTALETAM